MSTKLQVFDHMTESSSISDLLNSLPHMPILGYSNSAANKNMMSKI